MPKREQRKVYPGRRQNRPAQKEQDMKLPDIFARIHKLRKKTMNNAEIYELLTYYKYLSEDMSRMLEEKLNSPEVMAVKKEISELKNVKSENSALKKQVKTLLEKNEILDSKVETLDGNLTALTAKLNNYEDKFKVVDAIDTSIWKILQEKNGTWTVKHKDGKTSNADTILEALIG